MKVKLDEGAYMPTIAHEADAGYDLYTPENIYVPAEGQRLLCDDNTGAAVVDTGVHVEIPKNYVGFIKSKSGLNVNHGLTTEGVIDSGYTGSIRIKLYNHSLEPYCFERGDKIAQLIILPIITPKLELVDELEETERGDGGFGSTGR